MLQLRLCIDIQFLSCHT